MSTTLWIILAGAVLTYLTRIGGHLVLSRFEHIHPRVEAGLNAVPAAVLTTLVAPAAMHRPGRPSWPRCVVAGLVALRGGMLAMFLAGARGADRAAAVRRLSACDAADPAQSFSSCGSGAVAFSSQASASPSTIGPISASTRA